MSMEELAEARKQKLLLLRKRKADEESGQASNDNENDAALMVKRHFRNYDPLTGQMKRFGGVRDLPDTVEKDVDGVQHSTIEDDERRQMEELDLINIAPKRPNWDLKRDLQKRLAKLERKDKEAVLLLIRQRIKSQQKDSNTTSAGTNEANVSALGAEIAASATEDVGALRRPSHIADDDDDSASSSSD